MSLTRAHHHNVPISKSLTFITSAKSLLPWKVVYSQVLGIRPCPPLRLFCLLCCSELVIFLSYWVLPRPDMSSNLHLQTLYVSLSFCLFLSGKPTMTLSRNSMFPRPLFLVNFRFNSSVSFMLPLQFWQMSFSLSPAWMLEYLIFSVFCPVLVYQHCF